MMSELPPPAVEPGTHWLAGLAALFEAAGAAVSDDLLWDAVMDQLARCCPPGALLIQPAAAGAAIREVLVRGGDPRFLQLVMAVQPGTAGGLPSRGDAARQRWRAPGDRLLDLDRGRERQPDLVLGLSTPEGAVTLARLGGAHPEHDHCLSRLRDALLPGLEQALRAALQMAQHDQSRRRVQQLMDSLPLGVLVTDDQGVIREANRPALELLAGRSDVGVVEGRLQGPEGGCAGRLLQAIGEAASASGRTRALELDRAPKQAPCLLVVAPLQRIAGAAAVERCALVLLGGVPWADEDLGLHLGQLYGLSQRERELAMTLMRGGRIEDHASESGIGISTARSQLQTAFAKTGTSRQGELTHLLQSIPKLASAPL